MKLRTKRLSALFISISMCISLIAGCGSKQEKAPENQNNNSNTANTLPIVQSPLKLKVFASLDQKAAMVVKSYAEHVNFKELEKRTNISIEWLHPPVGQEKEQFNLMLASNDLPDMVYWSWGTLPGGPQKYVEDNVILPLNDYLKYAPNFKQLVESDKDVKRICFTKSDQAWGFPLVFGGKQTGEYPAAWLGPQIRKDWLDRLGLKMPETIPEWYNVLKAFKEKDADGDGNPNNQIPFTAVKLNNSNMGLMNFTAGFGTLYGFMVKGSEVKYSVLEPEFKNYVSEMAKWYKEGLIDPDFAANDAKTFDAKVSGGKAGAYFTGATRWAKYISQNIDNKNFKLAGAPWPKTAAGKSYTALTELKNVGTGDATIITKQSKHPVECAKWLDYQYSQEGTTLMNWGVKDVTYVEENGKRRYTDNIMKDALTKSIEPELAKYTSVAISGWSCIQDGIAKRTTMSMPGQLDLYDLWGKASNDLLLPLLYPNPEESAALSQKLTDIETYRDEMVTKFIMGIEPMENFEKFVQKIKSMDIDSCIKIMQKNYDEVMKK